MPVIVLTRHGLTTRSDPEQHLGQRIDVGLSEDGRGQAAALAARLATVDFWRILTSPLRRARETADVVAAAAVPARPRPEADARLLEMDYGDWEGLTYEQIEARDAERRRAWEADPATLRCPGGESGNDVADRARDLLRDLLAEAAEAADAAVGDRPILLVGHSTLNRILIAVALGLPLREYRQRIVQGQVNLTALEWAPGAPPDAAKLLLLNDLAHVRRPSTAPWQ